MKDLTFALPSPPPDVKPSPVSPTRLPGPLSLLGAPAIKPRRKRAATAATWKQTQTFQEYGYDGLVSTRCDVYSYGIMLMETFTRKKPNSQMFCGNITLQSWVKESLPDRVIDVIDSNLVALNEENFSEKVKCLSSIMELALCCSANSPVERISMKDVLVALQKIKRLFLTQ